MVPDLVSAAKQYYLEHDIAGLFQGALLALARERPENACQFLAGHYREKACSPSVVVLPVAEKAEADLLSMQSDVAIGIDQVSEGDRCRVVQRSADLLRSPALCKAAVEGFMRKNGLRNSDSGPATFSSAEFGAAMRADMVKWLPQADLGSFLDKAIATALPFDPVLPSDAVDAYMSVIRAVRDRHCPMQLRRQWLVRQNPRKLDHDYQWVRDLGKGTFGKAALYRHRASGAFRVVKTVRKRQLRTENTSIEHVQDEVEVLRSLDHPHVGRIFEFVEEPVDDPRLQQRPKLHLILEAFLGGTLEHVIDKAYTRSWKMCMTFQSVTGIPETWVRCVTRQLLGALVHVHGKHIVHRDIKPANILLLQTTGGDPTMKGSSGSPSDPAFFLQSPHAVLIDFGISSLFKPEVTLTSWAGTIETMAPEVIKHQYGPKVDVWALGIVTFELLCGAWPFSDTITTQAILSAEHRWSLLGKFGRNSTAEACLRRLLERQPERRPSADDALGDAWLQNDEQAPNVDESEEEVLSSEERDTLTWAMCRSHLFRVVANHVAMRLDVGQVRQLAEAFEAADADKSGELSTHEVKAFLTAHAMTPSDASAVLAALDLDSTGTVSYTEFVAGLLELVSDREQAVLDEVFNIYDTNGDGTLSREELKIALTGWEEGQEGGSILPDGVTVDQLFSDLDKDGQGRISAEEFREYIRQEAEKRARH